MLDCEGKEKFGKGYKQMNNLRWSKLKILFTTSQQKKRGGEKKKKKKKKDHQWQILILKTKQKGKHVTCSDPTPPSCPGVPAIGKRPHTHYHRESRRGRREEPPEQFPLGKDKSVLRLSVHRGTTLLMMLI